jgi:hypothetical protein
MLLSGVTRMLLSVGSSPCCQRGGGVLALTTQTPHRCFNIQSLGDFFERKTQKRCWEFLCFFIHHDPFMSIVIVFLIHEMKWSWDVLKILTKQLSLCSREETIAPHLEELKRSGHVSCVGYGPIWSTEQCQLLSWSSVPRKNRPVIKLIKGFLKFKDPKNHHSEHNSPSLVAILN